MRCDTAKYSRKTTLFTAPEYRDPARESEQHLTNLQSRPVSDDVKCMLRDSTTLRNTGGRFAESRDNGRVPMSAKAQIRLNDGSSFGVDVQNLSLGGIGIRSERPIEVGTCFHLDLETGALHVNGHAKIVWTREAFDNGFEASAEFQQQ
jgi:hypothetical protein